MRYPTLKRLLDLFAIAATCWFTVPALAILAVLVRLDSPGPVFFRQKRVGKKCKLFDILKFRTMRTDTPRDIATHLLQNPERYITRMGNFLRKTSLDELPQLINILTGDMTLVGPRPALWNQYDLVAEREKYGVNDITPGLTGLAQINGRDELPIQVKAKYDGEYRKNMSLKLDLTILFGTLPKVLFGSNIVEGDKR